MEDLVMIESKDYAQVVFDDVKECYSENQHLECLFNLNELLKADSSDWIGIYKVGFTNYKDFVCKQQIDFDSISDFKAKIVFQADQLPKDDGEFYQFVYVSQSKQIRGASIPFQFKKTHLSDFIEIEEHEAIIYKSKESAINDTLIEIKSRCHHLTQANDTYERLIKENEEIIRVLKDEVSSVKLRCLRLTMDNERLNHTLKNKADNLKTVADQLTNLANENNKLQDKFESLSTENKNLFESLQQRLDQIEELKGELQSVKLSKEELESVLDIKEAELWQLNRDKDELSRISQDLNRINDQVSKLEHQVEERVGELTKIREDLKRNEALVAEQTKTIQNILLERDNLTNHIQKLSKEKTDLEYSQENLSQELNMSRDKLLAAEQCKEMLRAQLVVLTNELSEANNKISKQLDTIQEFSAREKQSEIEKSDLVDKIEKMQVDHENKLQESNGSYFALKLAHSHLETRLKSSDLAKTKSDKEAEIYKQSMEKLKQENDDLKERIKAGAKEYSKLFEKYRIVKNKQFNHDINVYHDLNGGVHLRRELNSHSHILYANSTQHENEFDSDSAIQDKSMSQSGARASSADIENTLLDALLGSSIYNNQQHQHQQQPANLMSTSTQLTQLSKPLNGPLNNIRDQLAQLNFNSPSTSKHGANETNINNNNQRSNDTLSDDGLVNPRNKNNVEQLRSTTSSNLMNHNRLNFSRSEEIQSEDNDNVFSDMSQSLSHSNSNSNLARMAVSSSSRVPSDIIRSCDICNYIFPTESNVAEIEKHYSSHYGPSCPICFLTFRKGYPQPDFENHVNSHFSS